MIRTFFRIKSISFSLILLSSETRQPVDANISINARSRISVHAIRIRSISSAVNAFFFFFVTLIFLIFLVGSLSMYSSSASHEKKDEIADRLLLRDIFDIPLLCLYAYRKFLISVASISFTSLYVKNSANCVKCRLYCSIVLFDLFSISSVAKNISFNFRMLSLYSANSVVSFLICTSLSSSTKTCPRNSRSFFLILLPILIKMLFIILSRIISNLLRKLCVKLYSFPVAELSSLRN